MCSRGNVVGVARSKEGAHFFLNGSIIFSGVLLRESIGDGVYGSGD